MTVEVMDPYDKQAWDEIQQWKQGRLLRPDRQLVPARIRQPLRRAGVAARQRLRTVPGVPQFEQAVHRSIGGMSEHGSRLALASVQEERILGAYRRRGHDVSTLRDIRALDLSDIDAVIPKLGLAYASAGTIEGAGAGLLISGSVVGGPAVVVGAVAMDVSAVLLGGLRLVAHVGAYYGYDTSSEEETALALAVLGVGTAADVAGKVAAYQELSMVAQRLLNRTVAERAKEFFFRKATLPDSPVVTLVTHVLARFGFRISTRNVLKMLPAVGMVLGAGQNAWMMHRFADDANRFYRELWLREKYGIDAETGDGPPAGDDFLIIDALSRSESAEGEDK